MFLGDKSVFLYINSLFLGDKSEVLDIDNPDLTRFPKFANVQRYEGMLSSGDILFIPGRCHFYIKEPLLLIGKSSLCGRREFPFSLSEWSLTIYV